LTRGYEASVTILQTNEINLSSPEGKSAPKVRIASAVDKVCGVSSGSIDIEERRAINACRARPCDDVVCLSRHAQTAKCGISGAWSTEP